MTSASSCGDRNAGCGHTHPVGRCDHVVASPALSGHTRNLRERSEPMRRALMIAAANALAMAGLTVTGCNNRDRTTTDARYDRYESDVRYRDTVRPAGGTAVGVGAGAGVGTSPG